MQIVTAPGARLSGACESLADTFLPSVYGAVRNMESFVSFLSTAAPASTLCASLISARRRNA